MATPPESVRAQLTVVTTSAVAELAAQAARVPAERQVSTLLASLALVVPPYYDDLG